MLSKNVTLWELFAKITQPDDFRKLYQDGDSRTPQRYGMRFMIGLLEASLCQ